MDMRMASRMAVPPRGIEVGKRLFHFGDVVGGSSLPVGQIEVSVVVEIDHKDLVVLVGGLGPVPAPPPPTFGALVAPCWPLLSMISPSDTGTSSPLWKPL